MKPPNVSVIVPNYNHGRHLALRLQSILDQTYQDFELLYLDDASTDNSAQVFARFADDPRIRAFTNPTNTGNPSVQWNKGVSLARGQYVWIAEADDFADPRLLEVLVGRLDRHPDAGLAYCQSWETDADGHALRPYTFHTDTLDPRRWQRDFLHHGPDECRRYLAKLNTIPNASAVVFRRSLYLDVGGADETLAYCGDWLLWFHILMRADVVFVAEPMNYYRRHEGAFSNQASLDIGQAAHAVYHKLVAAYPEVMTPYPDGRPRWPAIRHYELGRHALREHRLPDARRHFKTSLRHQPFASTVLFYAASYLGRPVYAGLDGLKLRLKRKGPPLVPPT